MTLLLPWRRTVTAFAAAGLLCASAAGCGGSDAPSSSGAAPAPAATTAPAATATDVGETVSAAELCAFLEKNLPRWKSAGGEFAAMTQVTTELFDFYQQKDLVPPDQELDPLTRAECPQVRTEVLKTIGFDSFVEL